MARSKENIIDIARQAEVSIATVSRVVNHRPDVSDYLRGKVQEVLAKSNFRPRVISNRPTHIAIVMEMELPLLEDFWANILSGISKYAFEQGVVTSILFFSSLWAQKVDLLKAIRERRCNAAVLLGPAKLQRQLDSLAKSGIPTILVAERSDIPNIGFLDAAGLDGAVSATEYLISLDHKRIAFLAGSLEMKSDHCNRLAGYKRAMRAANLEINPDWIISHIPLSPTPSAGYEQTKLALLADPTITAIIAVNDSMAYGAILACSDLGRRVPDDISIIGFDDYPNSAYSNPPLTTIRQPMLQMGYEAAKAADTMARGIIDAPPRQVFSGELIVRKSTKICRDTLK